MHDYGTIVTSPLPLIYAVKTGLANVGAEPRKQLGEPEVVGWQK